MSSPRAAVFASPPHGCSERTWCTNGRDEAHLEVHASKRWVLDGFGWSVQLVEERGSRPVLTIEGAALAQEFQVDLDPMHAFVLMNVLGTGGGREALDELLGASGVVRF